MKVDIRPIGNSLGVILPRPVLKSWGVGEGDQLEISDKGLRPSRKSGLAPWKLDGWSGQSLRSLSAGFVPARIRAQILGQSIPLAKAGCLGVGL